MLTARTATEDYVEAADAEKGVAYFCRGCEAPVVFHAGPKRIWHFAHKPGAACAFGAKMSLAHLEAQRRIADALRARGVVARLEVILPSVAGDRRIDVLAHPPDRPDAKVAIEVQASDLTETLIAARSRSYDHEGIAPLWLRLLDFGVFEKVEALPFRGTVWIDRYHAKAWERWAHDQLGGRLWFLDSGTWRAWRGTFVPAHSYREVSTWYGPGGEEQSAGGDWRDIVQWVELELEGPFEFGELQLKRGRIKGADGQVRLGAWFVPPGEDGRLPPHPFVKAEIKPSRYHLIRAVSVFVDGRWVPASFDGARSDWRTVRQVPHPVVG